MAEKAPTKHKYDLFKVLGQVNIKKADYYDSLDEDLQKQIQPLLIQRWMSGTSSARQVFLLNEVANPYVFSLFKHKTLLWQLLTISAPGKFAKYNWMSQKGTKDHNKPVATKIVMEYYGYSSKHAIDALKVLTYENVVELAHNLGHQSDTISKLKKEF
jgi:hypothetical protein